MFRKCPFNNYSSIKSFESSQIKFVQESKTTVSHGWVDFNEASIGLTSWSENQEIYTEIRYKSITEWYLISKWS